jgi:hypothetical protein
MAYEPLLACARQAAAVAAELERIALLMDGPHYPTLEVVLAAGAVLMEQGRCSEALSKILAEMSRPPAAETPPIEGGH